MKKYPEISVEERNALLKQHKASRDGHQRDRTKAVLCYSKGSTIQQIADHLLVNDQTVRNHLALYHSEKRLKKASGGNYQGKLTAEQTQELSTHLSTHTYANTQQIQVYIKKQYNVEYSIAGLTDWLHRQGFTYKKPKGLPAKADTERQKAFIDYYKKLEESLPPTQGLVFIDSAHPTQATKLSYGWIKKGVSKAVKTSASRTRVNITGAVDIQTKQVYARCYDSINASSMISFLNDLQRQACYSAKEKIHVILDGAGYHRSKELAEWIAKNPRYQLHFLPPYSPNLNPIERLWKIMNEHMRNNRYFTTAKEFRDAISYFFEHKILELHEVLQKRITSNFQVLQI